MPNVTFYLSAPEVDRLKKKAERKGCTVFALVKGYVQQGLRDEDDEQGNRGTEETSSRPRERDTEPHGATAQEPDWKRKYEEYKRKYGAGKGDASV